MSNLILVFVCLLLGLLFQRLKRFPENSADVLNVYVIFVALPALVLNEIARLTLDLKALLPIVIAWLVMASGAGLTWLIAQRLKWSRSLTGAMVLLVGLGNTGFVGIPLIEAHLGRDAIPYAILYDQFGTFLALNTVGIAVAGYYSAMTSEGKKPSIVRNILGFPPFLALMVALILKFTGYPEWLLAILPRLANTLVPVVMVAVGFQWRLRLARDQMTPLAIALLLILFVEPVLACVLVSVLGLQGLIAHVIVLEASMPAMISAGVLAMSYNLESKLVSAIVGYSLMLSLVTVWLWKLFLS